MKQERITIEYRGVTYLDVEIIQQGKLLTILVYKIHRILSSFDSELFNEDIDVDDEIILTATKFALPYEYSKPLPTLFKDEMSNETHAIKRHKRSVKILNAFKNKNIDKIEKEHDATYQKFYELKNSIMDEDGSDISVLFEDLKKCAYREEEIATLLLKEIYDDNPKKSIINTTSKTTLNNLSDKVPPDKLSTINDILLSINAIKTLYDNLIKDVDKLETEKLPKAKTWTDYLYYGATINHIYTSIHNLISKKDVKVNSKILELLVMYVTTRKLYQMFNS